MPRPRNGPNMLNPKVMKIVVMLLLVLFCYRMCIIAPQFFPWFLSFTIGAFVLFKIYRFFSRAVFPICPKCDDVMDLFLKQNVFMGADNAEGGKSFSPISLEKCQCPTCDNIHLRLRYKNSIGGDARDFYITRAMSFSATINSFNLVDQKAFNEFDNKAITDYQYNKMIKELKSMVIENNRKAGFPDNEKDIKLK